MKTIVLKVGGSLLSRSEDTLFNFEYALRLKDTLLPLTQQGYKFILCVGGGFLTRKYQELFREQNIPDEDLHQIGVAIINLNAECLQSVFKEISQEQILRYADYDETSEISIPDEKPFLVTAAGKPGHSSDWNTAKLAVRSKSNTIISLKNVDGVYSADPKKDPNAKRIESLSWDEYLQIIGNVTEHHPGASYPVDPIASEFSKANNLKFYIIHGDDLENLAKTIRGENFNGSIIR